VAREQAALEEEQFAFLAAKRSAGSSSHPHRLAEPR